MYELIYKLTQFSLCLDRDEKLKLFYYLVYFYYYL